MWAILSNLGGIILSWLLGKLAPSPSPEAVAQQEKDKADALQAQLNGKRGADDARGVVDALPADKLRERDPFEDIR